MGCLFRTILAIIVIAIIVVVILYFTGHLHITGS